MFFFNLLLIPAKIHILPQSPEDLELAPFVALGLSSFFNLHQEPLLHLDLFKLSIALGLLISEAPASENLCFAPEDALLERFVEDEFHATCVQLHSVEGLSLALSNLSLHDGVKCDDHFVNVKVSELLPRLCHL